MALIEALVEVSTRLIASLGYIGIFALMAAESALIPIPSEAVMPFAGFLAARGEMNLLLASLAGTAGNIAGSLVLYAAGRALGRERALAYLRRLGLREGELARAEELFTKWGHAAVFVGRLLPAVRTIISLPAGVARMPLLPFTVYTALGSAIWCTALAVAGSALGENWNIIERYAEIADAALLAAAAVLVVAVLIRVKRGEGQGGGCGR